MVGPRKPGLYGRCGHPRARVLIRPCLIEWARPQRLQLLSKAPLLEFLFLNRVLYSTHFPAIIQLGDRCTSEPCWSSVCTTWPWCCPVRILCEEPRLQGLNKEPLQINLSPRGGVEESQQCVAGPTVHLQRLGGAKTPVCSYHTSRRVSGNPWPARLDLTTDFPHLRTDGAGAPGLLLMLVPLFRGGVWLCGLKFSPDHMKRLTFK
jgi:hypothetical protein